MSANLKVVNLHSTPPTTDIAGNLRMLADKIERGELGPYDGVLVISMPTGHYKPEVVMFGQTMLRHALAGVCMHTANLIIDE